MLLPLFLAAVVLSHWTLLRLPYFWDEGGYYIPAALDLFKTGTLIPQTTATNAHPPLPMILMAGWWKVFGFHILATRLLVCLVSSSALLGVFRLARIVAGKTAAWTTAALTAIYPVWFAQSTLAHADIFAAAFTLWGLSFYLGRSPNITSARPKGSILYAGVLFSLAALAKETAIVTPLALAIFEVILLLRQRKSGEKPFPDSEEPLVLRAHRKWMAALLAPVLPLAGWYAYHRAMTGFIFGNPEFLRYNATANLDAHRFLLCLWHRLLHLTMHMNMFVAVTCAVAAVLIPAIPHRPQFSKPLLTALAVVLIANLLEFSLLGGALLTRYLLPMYPLVILVCVTTWRRHMQSWGWLTALTGAAFLAGIWISPPYAFAPEDNLTYRDMVVLHQQAIAFIGMHYPAATVLTAWPASAELSRPELGYTNEPLKVIPIENFSLPQVQRAADPGAYDTALFFSTKWAPPLNSLILSRHNQANDTKYFDFHLDVLPAEAAALLHGEVVWQASRGGEWVAVLRFPRVVDASLLLRL